MDYNVKDCCKNNINLFYNYLNNTEIKEGLCYKYNNYTYTLDCYESSYKYHLFVYFLLVLFIVINLIIVFYSVCYCLRYKKKDNIYSDAEKNILIYKNNSLFSRKYTENNDFDN